MSAHAQNSTQLRGDVNGDGKVTITDAVAVVNIILNGGNEGGTGEAPAGVEAVDLGLPSGTLWANMNVGATSPEGYGDFFAWGETTPQSNNQYDWTTYKWCKGEVYTLTKYCTHKEQGFNGFTDGKSVLDAEDDAATVYWGDQWCTPTKSQCDELIENTTAEWTTMNGVKGCKLTSKINNNSIFIPAAGVYWETKYNLENMGGLLWASLYESNSLVAWTLTLGEDGAMMSNIFSRTNGNSVRPVKKMPSITASLEVSSTSLSPESTASQEKLNITCNSSWTVRSDQSWCTVTPSSGIGNQEVTFKFAENTNSAERSATVTLQSGTETKTVTVTQKKRNKITTDLEAVDLGLPSGTLWANMNVGASNPEEAGDYFAWGEIKSQEELKYSWTSYKWCKEGKNTLTKYCYDSSYGADGFTDDKRVLLAEDDAATANLGNNWYMPSKEQCEELLMYTTSEWTTLDGVAGYKFTSSNGNSIFIPASGAYWYGILLENGSSGTYWTAQLSDTNPHCACYFGFNSSSKVVEPNSEASYRFGGCPVRPVKNGASATITLDVSTTSLPIPSTETSGQFSVICNGEWTASSDQTWCTLSPNDGTANQEVTVKVTPSSATAGSTNVKNRTATITVTAGTLTKTVTVIYKAQNDQSPAGAALVDLGLPSGTLWANMNVGATSPEESGDCFAWGETSPQEDAKYSWESYKWTYGNGYALTKYCLFAANGHEGFTDGKSILDTEDDAAYANWGNGWRMPMRVQVQELIDNTTYKQDVLNGVKGIRFTGKNGNSIFLPYVKTCSNGKYSTSDTSGAYWTTDVWESSEFQAPAYLLQIYSEAEKDEANAFITTRNTGLPIRPVQQDPSVSIKLNLSSTLFTYMSSAGSGQLNIACTGSWSATSDQSWCTLSSASGTGNGELTIYTTANSSTSERTATVTVKAGVWTKTVTVTQKGTNDLSGANVEAVDLGLPSGTLWANMNIGADSPEDSGNYFAFGETVPQVENIYNWSTYKWCEGTYNTLTKYCKDSNYGSNGFTDDKTYLDSEDDAAIANWGGKWFMPTEELFQELIDNTTSEWTTQNGVYGYKFTSTNGNSIFLPVGNNDRNYYWTSTCSDNVAVCFSFDKDKSQLTDFIFYRYRGHMIRPICLK